MEKDYLVLQRASASRPSCEWDDDDYDVLANGVVVGRILKVGARDAVDVDPRALWASRRSHANSRICSDTGGRHGCIREALAAGVRHF